jgi:[ribosomal protein S5]-alanine N-acetyltransferase
MIPTLTTERLVLVPYEIERIRQQHINWLNDPNVARYSEQRHRRHTLATQSRYLQSKTELQPIWLIRIKNNGLSDDLGTIGANVDSYNQVADMEILIGEKALWGHGYGTEAWRAVMNYLFTYVRKIEAGCMQDNDGMCEVCTKTGMRYEGFRLGHFLLNGQPHNLVMYGLLSEMNAAV